MQIIVLGMHRSGTSTVARLLNLMGAYFAPSELAMPPTEHNEKGYWERLDVFGVHEEMFHALGIGWDRVSRFNAQWLAEPEFVAQFRPRIDKILLDLDAQRPWFVKDPRLNLFLPFWRPLLEVPVCIHVYRNPIQVAQSLKKREGYSIQFGLALWEQYSLLGLAHSLGMPCLWISYHDLIVQPVETTRRLHAQLLNLEVQGLRMPSEREIIAFIEPRLHHQKGDQILQNGYVNAQQKELDQAFSDGRALLWTELPSLSAGAAEILQAHEKAYEKEVVTQTKEVVTQTKIAHLTHELEDREQQAKVSAATIRELTIEAARLEQDLEKTRRWGEDSMEALKERITEVTRLQDDLGNVRHQSIALAQEIDAIRKSISWRMTAPIRVIGFQLPWLDRQIHQAPEWMERFKSFWWNRENQPTHLRVLDPGAKSSSPCPSAPVDHYTAWLRVNHWNPRSESELYRRLAMHHSRLPKISVVMPVYNPPIRFLTRAIQSLRCQLYTYWELCIADDASSDERVRPYLKELAWDSRITVCFREENGHISAATNSAAALATGDFILLMDQDDELAINALAEVALSIADHPETDLLYSDCDKIDAEGNRYDPHFKPDWSPELLLSYMYAGQVLVIRRGLFERIGGMRQGFEGSQDHDLALRAGELARQVSHIPAVLYHWRCFRGSTAFSGHEKPYSFVAGLKAVQSALDRRGSQGQAYQPDWAKRNGNGIYHIRFPDTGPSITLIIPTHNRTDLLRQCLNSLRRTTYLNYQVMVVDNESDQVEAQRYLQQLQHEVVRIPNQRGKGFSFSYVMNEAVRQARTDYVLFLNDDTEVITPEWLSSMVGYAELPGVGAVGALLRYKDGKVQHAGVVHGMDGLCDHAFKLTRRGDNGYLSYIAMARNCSAVTAACMLTRRQLFLEMGGFDTDQFAVAYNDPDYCYRLRDRGYRVVYTPDAELFHFEGQTRGFSDKPREIAAYRKRFKTFDDPYLNPNLSRENPSFEITPRRVRRDFNQALRVAMFTHNLNWEGAPKQMQEIAGYLHRQGMIKPLIFSQKDGPLRDRYEKMGIEVRIFEHPLIKHQALPGYMEALGEMGALLADEAVDVVYANTLHSFVAVDMACEARLPCLWAIHESEGWRHYFDFVPPTLRSRPIECFAYPYRVIFVAKQTRQIYRDLDWYHNFAVIPNGLEPGSVDLPSEVERKAARRALGLGENDIGVLSVGTVCERKRQVDLIEAIACLHEDLFKSRDVRFFIIGDRDNEYSGRMHKVMETLSQERRERLTVLPETPDVVSFYHACDIFVLTSGMESYPRVILEAMSAGLAILTTPVNGVVEQVREGINADYFPVGDIRQLTARLTALIQDRQRRESYRTASPVVLRGLTDHEEMGASYARLFYEAALASVPDA
ncbi:MAG: glycosyltransferase [Candidatus Contendobacter sp.]|nr:glycosyltransferase [Candidatus Contendobacter sp.]